MVKSTDFVRTESLLDITYKCTIIHNKDIEELVVYKNLGEDNWKSFHKSIYGDIYELPIASLKENEMVESVCNWFNERRRNNYTNFKN